MKCSFSKLEDGEYWVTIQHKLLQVMYQLNVRGTVATKAIEEIIASQEDDTLPTLPPNPAMEPVENLLNWVKLKHGMGGVVSRSTLEVVMHRLEDILRGMGG